jgi:gamma-butyrobetaine dioxygenase
MTGAAVLVRDGRAVRVTWPDGETHDFAARWLFDNVEEVRDPVSGQRRHGALALEQVRGVAAAEVAGRTLKLRFSPGGEDRHIDLGRLRGQRAARARSISLWPTPEPVAAQPPIAFDDYLRDDAALREALRRVDRWGLVILRGAGLDADACARAVERFGFVRETNYGRLFDVRIEPRPQNLALTAQALDLHADNPYRDPAPTLQLLHVLTADAGGGATLFVDGFAHAEALRHEAPDAFDRLARHPVRFTFTAGCGARWSSVTPVLRLGPTGALESLRLNHRSLDLPAEDAEELDAWYEAYLRFYRRLHAPGAAFERWLAPGEMVMFDNRRILHGRRALTGDSARWLRGCYADHDGLAATLARLERAVAEGSSDAA